MPMCQGLLANLGMALPDGWEALRAQVRGPVPSRPAALLVPEQKALCGAESWRWERQAQRLLPRSQEAWEAVRLDTWALPAGCKCPRGLPGKWAPRSPAFWATQTSLLHSPGPRPCSLQALSPPMLGSPTPIGAHPRADSHPGAPGSWGTRALASCDGPGPLISLSLPLLCWTSKGSSLLPTLPAAQTTCWLPSPITGLGATYPMSRRYLGIVPLHL